MLWFGIGGRFSTQFSNHSQRSQTALVIGRAAGSTLAAAARRAAPSYCSDCWPAGPPPHVVPAFSRQGPSRAHNQGDREGGARRTPAEGCLLGLLVWAPAVDGRLAFRCRFLAPPRSIDQSTSDDEGLLRDAQHDDAGKPAAGKKEKRRPPRARTTTTTAAAECISPIDTPRRFKLTASPLLSAPKSAP